MNSRLLISVGELALGREAFYSFSSKCLSNAPLCPSRSADGGLGRRFNYID